jgi:serine/threonine-protein kinase
MSLVADTRIGGFEIPAVDPVGRTMGGRFEIRRLLGTGGMGAVYEALDTSMARPVAVKLLRADLARDGHQVQRFEREARAAASLAQANVVGVTELVRDDALGLGLVMELLAGESLATRLERGPLGEREAVNVFMQALDGLAAAHAAGMVHRDLKPSNIFLVPLAGGVLVKLLDFGIVKLAEDGAAPKLTRKGALVGTPTYMSPEQVACAPVDARSDVYSMGACLYEALVAQPPYDGPHPLALVAAVGAGPPPDLLQIDPGVSPDLVHIVRVAMARDPSARYQNARAMREALRGAVIAEEPRAPRKPEARDAPTLVARPTPTARTRSPYVLAIGVGLFVLLALAIGVVIASRSIPTPASPGPAPTPIAPPAPPTMPIAAPPPTTATVAPPPPTSVPVHDVELPRGIEPPPPSAPVVPARPDPGPRPPSTRPPESHRPHVGQDVIMDPFAE